jgi:hypothetical protein
MLREFSISANTIGHHPKWSRYVDDFLTISQNYRLAAPDRPHRLGRPRHAGGR